MSTEPIRRTFAERVYDDTLAGYTEQLSGNMAGSGKPSSPPLMPSSSADRKRIPLFRGLLRYFPAALSEVAKLSMIANEQHNPGEPMHWARGKSDDHADCLVRHLLEAGTVDTDGVRHSAKVAWRALALLQLELEKAASRKAPDDA